MNTRIASCLLAVLAAALFAPPHATAQDAYPDRIVRLVVPYPAGGGTDSQARIIADALSKLWPHKVVTENRSSATGTLGSNYVARSAPDGYTLLYGTVTSHGVNSAVNPAGTPYDPIKDFTPIALTAMTEQVVLVPGSSPYKTLKELLDAAKARPGKLNLGVTGVASQGALGAALIKDLAKIDITIVPYNGAAAATNALLGKQIDANVATLSGNAGFIRGGEFRALATFSATRGASLPDVPSIVEAGYPSALMGSWSGILGPANLPAGIVRQIHDDLARAADNQETRKRMIDLGTELTLTTTEKFAELIKSNAETLARIAKQANVRQQ